MIRHSKVNPHSTCSCLLDLSRGGASILFHHMSGLETVLKPVHGALSNDLRIKTSHFVGVRVISG